MRKEASLEQWEKLYEVAMMLKEMRPWEELWDMDLVTIYTSDEEEPSVCSIMGRGGQCIGIAAYTGFKAISEFLMAAESTEMPQRQLIRYHNNLMCFIGDREELTSKERSIIKDLGLQFRGKNNWIYFRAFELGFMPYMPDEKQVLKLTEILQHLFMAIRALHKGLKVDFEGGKTLVRKFDKKSKLWLNYQAPVLEPQIEYPVPVLGDELLLTSCVNDKKYDKPIMPRLCILADARSGLLLDQNVVEPEDDDIDVVFDIVFKHILKEGRPQTINVRDVYLQSILLDVCNKLGIELEVNQRLEGIDQFLQEFEKRE